MKIFIVFSSEDLKNIFINNNDNYIIIGDVNNDKVIKPFLNDFQENHLTSVVKELFDKEKSKKLKHILAFSNKFYQSSVLPIASYIHTLKTYLKKHPNISEVVFPYKILFSQNRSTYNLAEHEVQTKLLYNRNEIIQPYLEILCRNNYKKINYIRKSRISFLFIKTKLRRYIIFFIRFAFSIFKFFYNKFQKKEILNYNNFDFISLTRLPRKSEYLSLILNKMNFNSLLISNEIFLSLDSNYKFCNKFFKSKNLVISKSPPTSLFEIFNKYFSVFIIQLFKKKISIDYYGVKINITAAFKELIIDHADLSLYISSLNSRLKKIPKTNYNFLLSTEIKSPYAYVDFYISKKRNLKCIHIMDCDISIENIPIPIFGDLLLTNNYKYFLSLKRKWKLKNNKIQFWGNLTSFDIKKNIKKLNLNLWCFFTSSNFEENQFVVKKIHELYKKLNIRIVLKLHPRDNKNYYKTYKEFLVIKDDSILRNELFNLFNYAITFNSAVIHDLFIYNKPFFIIDSKFENNFNQNVHSINYKKILFKHHEIFELIKYPEKWIKFYQNYNLSYIKDLKNKNIKTFKNKLIKFSNKPK